MNYRDLDPISLLSLFQQGNEKDRIEAKKEILWRLNQLDYLKKSYVVVHVNETVEND